MALNTTQIDAKIKGLKGYYNNDLYRNPLNDNWNRMIKQEIDNCELLRNQMVGLNGTMEGKAIVYPVIEVPATDIPRWDGGAYCLFFVYTKDKGNFILKGFQYEVGTYLKGNYDHYFFYASMWKNGVSRGYWHFWKQGVFMSEPHPRDRKYKYTITKFDDFHDMFNHKKTELAFKRMPKRWIPEFNQF